MDHVDRNMHYLTSVDTVPLTSGSMPISMLISISVQNLSSPEAGNLLENDNSDD